MDGEEDFDMLFGDDALAVVPNELPSSGPQLDRQIGTSDVIAQIEAIFETVADALLNERADVTISLNAYSPNNSVRASGRTPRTSFTFPGKTANEAWRFCWSCANGRSKSSTNEEPAVVIRLLELIHESVLDNVTLTKRYSKRE